MTSLAVARYPSVLPPKPPFSTELVPQGSQVTHGSGTAASLVGSRSGLGHGQVPAAVWTLKRGDPEQIVAMGRTAVSCRPDTVLSSVVDVAIAVDPETSVPV